MFIPRVFKLPLERNFVVGFTNNSINMCAKIKMNDYL